jgi:short-subunit dehydrogenase
MKKILVLGATSAIAQAFCKQSLQKSIHEFYLVGRNSDYLNSIALDLKVRGASNVYIEVADLNQFSLHEKLIQNAYDKLQGFDWALIAHGVLGNQKSAENNLDESLEIINSNYVSQATLINFVASIMEKNKQGVIGVLSSVAGDRGRRSNYIYGSAKSAINSYLSGLRVRLFKSNVQVLTIKMGFVDSPMTSQFPKGPLWAKPDLIARRLVPLFESNKNGEFYLPYFWRYIMIVIRAIPQFIFNKLDFL